MPPEPLLAGIFDPKGTLSPERARSDIERALAFQGHVRILQSGPLTVGVAPAEATSAGTEAASFGIGEGHPRIDGRWAADADLLEAWLQRGDQALQTFRGSFALVLWDAGRQTGTLVRDPMGERPVMWHAGARLTFAGDLRPLLDLVNPRPAPDETATACWLGLEVPADDRTMFEGVRRLRAGHQLTLSPAPWTPRPYWEPRYRDPMEGDPADLLRGMVERIESATAARLDGAGSVGVLLSGGIDSSTVAALAAPLVKRGGSTLRAYSAVFPGLPDANEGPLIDELVEVLDLHGTSMAVHGGSLLAGSLAYAGTWHAPDISANNFFQPDLLRRAGQEVDVLLDGEGGDELFMVPYYLLADHLRSAKIPEARRLLRRWPGIAGNHSRRLSARILRTYGLGGIVPHALARARWRAARRGKDSVLSREADRLVRAAGDPAPWKRLDGPLWWRHLAYQMLEGPDSFGAPEHALRIGRMAGVRRARPLLDVDLTTYVLRMPPDLAFSPWFTKGHIRTAMANRVPESVMLRRQKTWFTDVRLRSLMESDMTFASTLLGRDAEVRRYVRPEAIARVLSGPPQAPGARSDWGFKLQHLAATELWLQVQRDPGFFERTAPELDPVRYEIAVTGA